MAPGYKKTSPERFATIGNKRSVATGFRGIAVPIQTPAPPGPTSTDILAEQLKNAIQRFKIERDIVREREGREQALLAANYSADAKPKFATFKYGPDANKQYTEHLSALVAPTTTLAYQNKARLQKLIGDVAPEDPSTLRARAIRSEWEMEREGGYAHRNDSLRPPIAKKPVIKPKPKAVTRDESFKLPETPRASAKSNNDGLNGPKDGPTEKFNRGDASRQPVKKRKPIVNAKPKPKAGNGSLGIIDDSFKWPAPPRASYIASLENAIIGNVKRKIAQFENNARNDHNKVAPKSKLSNTSKSRCIGLDNTRPSK